jgi:hypothetical protein
LQDIASYGIARTLGVIDDVKASTSDKATIHPAIHINAPSSPSSLSTPTDSERSEDTAMPAYFTSEASNLKLSGVGVFSPAPSQPPSPTLSRRRLHPELESLTPMSILNDDDGLTFRKKAGKAFDA